MPLLLLQHALFPRLYTPRVKKISLDRTLSGACIQTLPNCTSKSELGESLYEQMYSQFCLMFKQIVLTKLIIISEPLSKSLPPSPSTNKGEVVVTPPPNLPHFPQAAICQPIDLLDDGLRVCQHVAPPRNEQRVACKEQRVGREPVEVPDV